MIGFLAEHKKITCHHLEGYNFFYVPRDVLQETRMIKISTSLLISDDLDDHQSFTEAFQKIMPSMVVVAVLSQDKALELLSSRKLVPDYIFLDLTAPDASVSKFLSALKTIQDGKPISVSVYGNEEDLGNNRWTGISHFEKEYEFPELMQFIGDLLKQANR
jgi:DNA-binding NtrC family response regulator